MPLSAQEKASSRRLLDQLDSAALFSLAGTVTKKKSTACTRTGAIDTILQNSKSASELLNRKKVRCDVIATHIRNEGNHVPSNITKSEAVQKTLAYWGSSTPFAGTFIPSLMMKLPKSATSYLSYPAYFDTSNLSTHSSQEDASKTWKLGALRPDLDEIPASVSFKSTDFAPSPPITDQEMISDSDVSDQQQRNVPFVGFFCPLSCEISKMSIQSGNKENEKEQRSIPQPCDLQTALHVPTGSTVQTVPYMTTSSTVNTVPPMTTHSTMQSVPLITTRSVVQTVPPMTTCAAVQTVPDVTTHSIVQTVPHVTIRPTVNTVPPMTTHSTMQTVPLATTCSMVQTVPPMTTHSMMQSVPYMTTCATVQTVPLLTTHCMAQNVSHMKTHSTLQTVPHVAIPSMLQTVRQPAIFEGKIEKVSSTPYTGITEQEDASCIWPVDCEKFTRDFCEWFFTLLNAQHQSSVLQKEDWGPQHFLENAEFQLTYLSARRKYSGGESASSHLLALVQEDKLTFSPNITSNGIKCERSPKGLVMMVGGTVFRNQSYLGTFDQIFEVVGNNKTKNWKIRYADLKIQKSS
ncbi:uncharacterized protein [Eleutherodactylus coqui]|uniref:uncharacterized protein n=1 Tax=Eleutherodactylus coqui TaxID=57060 RepID=UPI0034626C7A